jgi:hypothetical protein
MALKVNTKSFMLSTLETLVVERQIFHVLVYRKRCRFVPINDDNSHSAAEPNIHLPFLPLNVRTNEPRPARGLREPYRGRGLGSYASREILVGSRFVVPRFTSVLAASHVLPNPSL